MKKLPIGVPVFRDLINEDNLYVDKTKHIYDLVTGNVKYFFMSRPRRFGKSWNRFKMILSKITNT